MNKNRLEAFSDGVLAIIITILVLEMKAPHGKEWSSLVSLIPSFLAYILSFIYLRIYWNNHHHMLHTVKKISGKILWANLNLLFWLSMIPFVTAWVGEYKIQEAPVALYGIVLLMSALSYFILQNIIIKEQGPNSILNKAIKNDIKGKASSILYISAIIFAFFIPWISIILYIIVALLWLVPDKRIEKVLAEN